MVVWSKFDRIEIGGGIPNLCNPFGNWLIGVMVSRPEGIFEEEPLRAGVLLIGSTNLIIKLVCWLEIAVLDGKIHGQREFNS